MFCECGRSLGSSRVPDCLQSTMHVEKSSPRLDPDQDTPLLKSLLYFIQWIPCLLLLTGACLWIKLTNSALKLLQGEDIGVHWRVGGDRIQGERSARDKTHLENALAKNRYLLPWALKTTKNRMEVCICAFFQWLSVSFPLADDSEVGHCP